MGEVQSTNMVSQQKVKSQTQNHFLLKVQKVSEMRSQQWGNFNLYQQKEKPYDYFMRFVQNQIDETYLKKKKVFYNSLIEPKNKNIVPVAFTEINKNKGLCNTVYQLSVYCQYFNFTLQNAIKLKNKQKQEFHLSDILYIIKCLVNVAKFCQQQRKECSYMGIFKSKHIFVTPEGHLRIYPFSQNLSQMFISNNDDESSTFYQFNVKEQNSLKKRMTQPQPSKDLQRIILLNNQLQNSSSSRQFKKGLKIMNSKQQFFSKEFQNDFKEIDSKRKMSSHISQNFSSRIFNNKKEDVKDFFDFGLLLLQLFLLNEIEYYQYQIHQTFSNHQKNQIQLSDKSEFQKMYNMDRIKFSLEKQLVYKKVPKKLINLISKMILTPQIMNYSLIQKIISEVQESGVNAAFCLRFELQKEESQLQASKISSNLHQKLQRESQRSFKIIQQPQSIYLEDIDDLKHMSRTIGGSNVNLKNTSSTIFLKNNEQRNSKLKKSLMLSNQVSKQSLLLNMKIDKFLIPRKIRSISTQVSKNCSEKQL